WAGILAIVVVCGVNRATAQIETLPPPVVEHLGPIDAPVLLDESTVPNAVDIPDAPQLPVPAGDVVAESVETVIQPTWYNPMTWYNSMTWLSAEYWEGSVEVGMNGATGNADSLSFRTGFDLDRITPAYDWKIDLTYSRAQANGVENQHNALFNSSWDWKFANTRWSAFTRTSLEYDQFKSFDLRVALNGGLAYQLIDTEFTKLKNRFGAGASKEFGGPDDSWKPEAVFGFDFSHQFSARHKAEATVDYYPSWSDFSDYRIVTDASWQVLLDEATNLSLKIGVIDRYDSTPNGAEQNDLNYSMLLLWKI
ncbi:MAG: DUF481 domain-containing protein, partial [Planctomycetales bacterium]|nr:DUF481 domain-containing protein [Planctomycetales bacterium]